MNMVGGGSHRGSSLNSAQKNPGASGLTNGIIGKRHDSMNLMKAFHGENSSIGGGAGPQVKQVS